MLAQKQFAQPLQLHQQFASYHHHSLQFVLLPIILFIVHNVVSSISLLLPVGPFGLTYRYPSAAKIILPREISDSAHLLYSNPKVARLLAPNPLPLLQRLKQHAHIQVRGSMVASVECKKMI